MQTLSLGKLLVNKGLLSDDQLHLALHEQALHQQPLARALVRLGFLSETIIRDTLAESLQQDSIDLTTIIADPAALALIPQEWAQRYVLFPVSLLAETLTLAIADPDNIIALDQLRARCNGAYHIVLQLAAESDILHAINRHYGVSFSIDSILHEIEPDENESTVIITNNTNQPVIRLIDALLADAVQHNASDIHFEPENRFLRIRYRIDGVLRQMRSLHKGYWAAMVVRLKVMSGMNIAETRAPQDGHFSLRLSGRQIDFRVAVHPTTNGENLVLRILDRHQGIVPLAAIGLEPDALATLMNMIARPEGILLITGPTGSGKTTTLYSILHHLNSESVNIMTLEDPVEYPLAMTRQTSINEAIKLDFASGIRSLMRQDPDIILVGEIRDHATAEMAFRAAMTGHQVYSTLHTNSAIGAIPRLLDIGILPDIMAGNIIGIIAQRLVRALCPHCKIPYMPDAEERALLGIEAEESVQLYCAGGCDECQQQGYRGRMALLELLAMDDALDELIARRASARQILQHARSKGFRPLALDGIQRIRLGITSVAEVRRVVNLCGSKP